MKREKSCTGQRYSIPVTFGKWLLFCLPTLLQASARKTLKLPQRNRRLNWGSCICLPLLPIHNIMLKVATKDIDIILTNQEDLNNLQATLKTRLIRLAYFGYCPLMFYDSKVHCLSVTSYSTSFLNGLSAFSNPLSKDATKTFSLPS